MGQALKGRSEICPLPPGPLKELPRHMRSRTIMAVGLTLMLTTTSLVYYLMRPHPMILEPWEKRSYVPGTPHAAIAIDGDADFADTSLLEGWVGDGSPEDPYIIDGLEIDLGNETGNCIEIRNTRVSFIISNCNLTDAGGRPTMSTFYGCGIALDNVTNGELVNNNCTSNTAYGIHLLHSDFNTVTDNTCNNNGVGIGLFITDSNTVANNTCNNNSIGITLEYSRSNTVENNTCNSNGVGILLWDSNSNTVTNNTCFSNRESGIQLDKSNSNTVVNNTCNSNDNGISLDESTSNIVKNNICNNNGIGIYLYNSESNIFANNTLSGNTERDILEESGTEESGTEGTDPPVLMSVGLAALIIVLGGGTGLVYYRKQDGE